MQNQKGYKLVLQSIVNSVRSMLIRETTVIPKQEDEIMFIKFDELDMLVFLKMSQYLLEKKAKQNLYTL